LNKSELVTAIAEKANLEKNKTEVFLNNFVSVVIEAVAGGEKVQLIGFGTFESKHREGRTGRNPRNGKEIEIPASNSPSFKAGQAFKDAVNKK
jgi:DNA-binding protein HU-beta